MSTLAEQQAALLAALFDWPAQDAAARLGALARGVGSRPGRGLKVYQANGHFLAERALGAAYPVLVQLLGSDSFADLARALWHAQPPQSGDVAQWGAGLADFVQASAQLQSEPYLADVARAEWALHRASTAADGQADVATLALLTTEDAAQLVLRLAPGWAALPSRYPLASLLLAHREGSPSLEAVGQALQQGVAEDVLVWRAGLQPRLRQALPGECALLHGLQAGLALQPALDAAPALDFSRWLPLAVHSGLLLAVSPLSEPHRSPP